MSVFQNFINEIDYKMVTIEWGTQRTTVVRHLEKVPILLL